MMRLNVINILNIFCSLYVKYVNAEAIIEVETYRYIIFKFFLNIIDASLI